MAAKSERQRQAAVTELINRQILGTRKQRSNIKVKRPFGTATKEQIEAFTRLDENT